MRILVLALLFALSGVLPATARDCTSELPRGLPVRGFAYGDVIDCLLDEIASLQRAQSRMAARLDRTETALAEALSKVPADYENRDGKIATERDRPIGRARFVLTARTTGGPSSLPLDRAVVAGLCGDAGGCSLRLARRDMGLGALQPDGVGPCLFVSDPESGGWFRAAGCNGAEARGTDGSGGAIGSGGGEILAEAGGACLLADAEARRGPGPATELLVADQTPGLFLIAAPERAPDGAVRFRCELTLD